jgi:ubiquinone/menaquinone biosynthesis C-methylase UbiE
MAESGLDYGDVKFWNVRYRTDCAEHGKKFTYDWYVTYAKVKQTIESFTRSDKSERVLLLGCGNSTMAEKMYESGFLDITGVDFSHEVIDINIAKYREWPGMDFVVENVTSMADFDDGKFDLIIDKACTDALMCSFNSVEDVDRMNKEVYRLLAPAGQYFSISYGVQEMRIPHLESPNFDWEVTVSPIVGSSQHRIYRCEKADPDNDNAEQAHRKAQAKERKQAAVRAVS